MRRPSAQSAFLLRKAGSSIAQRPLAWLGLLAHKVDELLQGPEISRDTSIYASRLDNRVLAALIWIKGVAFPSALLIPLALVWVVLRAARREQAPLRPDLPGIRQAGRAGVPLIMRTLMLRASLLVMTYAAARLGEADFAAMQLALTIWTFLAFALDAVGTFHARR